MATKITKELLLQRGWTEVPQPSMFLMEKQIENRNPLNDDPDDTSIKLILHGLQNTQTFAIIFPNGSMLNFNVKHIEELDTLENLIDYYDCNY